jgi:hypothetical protein
MLLRCREVLEDKIGFEVLSYRKCQPFSARGVQQISQLKKAIALKIAESSLEAFPTPLRTTGPLRK